MPDCSHREELAARIAQLERENVSLTEALASRDLFLAVAAHELRNPMTAIAGRVGFLRRLIGKKSSSAEKIEASCDQLEWLIMRYMQRANILLDVARVNTGNFKFIPEVVDVHALMHEVVESLCPLAEHAGCDISFDLQDELALHTDRLSLEQIFDNLISNAIKYGSGSRIAIHAFSDQKNGAAYISVRDHGPGIDPADQARIFQRFERAVLPGQRATGFGIGLWVVRQLTEALGGTITVQSEPGLGSTFTIMMPLKLNKDTP